MPLSSFFSSFLPAAESVQLLDPAARKIKKSLEKALLNFQMATEVEFASKVSPQLFNNVDLYNFDKKDMMHLNEIRDVIDDQKDYQGLLSVAHRLLNSTDAVLRFCVAVSLAEQLNVPVLLELGNKSLKQLREMAAQDNGELVDKVKATLPLQVANQLAK